MKLFSRFEGGPQQDDALIILHGLLGSSANWKSLAKRFAQKRVVYSVDLRNHGQSPWSDDMDYTVMAKDVQQFMQGLDHQNISLLGHSMGGKVAMQLALNAQVSIHKLIIADIAPVSYQHDFDHLIQPMLDLPLESLENRAQADAQLATSIPSLGVRSFLLHNLAFNAPEQRWHWRPNLEVLLNSVPNLTAFEEKHKASFEQDALFVHGAQSDYLTEKHHARIKQHFPRAVFSKIQNAGHWLHAEQPKAFLTACESFLND